MERGTLGKVVVVVVVSGVALFRDITRTSPRAAEYPPEGAPCVTSAYIGGEGRTGLGVFNVRPDLGTYPGGCSVMRAFLWPGKGFVYEAAPGFARERVF